ncbi:MAG: Yip1 family protein [Gammaproteobacteria bacterium]|nr:Yip1 family protein [Gammaproteobacteria bacterium]MDJ0872080.1 Yip1 family protein [Gammaproteobacteria bacterium]
MLNHVWGLFSHPQQEWESIRDEPCTVTMCYVRHVLILAAVPAISAYIGAVQVGWSVGAEETTKLTASSALPIAIAFYLAMLAAVYVVGRLIHWMSQTFGAQTTLAQSVVLVTYTGTPLFLVGIVALYPMPWVNMLFGIVALLYTVYLLYTGVPVVMKITKEQGFLFSSAVLTVGMVTLVGMLAVTVILWGSGLGPAYR